MRKYGTHFTDFTFLFRNITFYTYRFTGTTFIFTYICHIQVYLQVQVSCQYVTLGDKSLSLTRNTVAPHN